MSKPDTVPPVSKGWWVKRNRPIFADGAVLVLTGGTPVPRLGSSLAPGDAALALAGGTPVVRLGQSLAPADAVLTLTGGTPFVPVGTVVSPAGAVINLTGSAPQLHEVIATTGADLTLTGGTPTLHTVLRPAGAVLSLTGGVPVSRVGIHVSPPGAALTLTGGTPGVIRELIPPHANLTLTGGTPVVSTPKLVVPTDAGLTLTGGTPTVTVSAAISFVSATSADAASVAMPTHQAGDLLLIFAWRTTSNVIPSLPAGWTNVITATTANTGSRVGFKIAASGSETSGTWTNGEGIFVHVLRNATAIGASAVTTGASNVVTYPAVTLDNPGASWVVGFAGHRSGGGNPTPPAGMVERRQQNGFPYTGASNDTDGPVSSWSGATGSGFSSALDWHGITIEIKP